MGNRQNFISLCFVTTITTLTSLTAMAGERQFYNGIQGKWSGPGEIVAGKFKGTKFNCQFLGTSHAQDTGMKVDGKCRIGMFTQPMNAVISKSGKSYSGKFLDGEAGEGMDVVGGRYTQERLVVGVRRKALNGTMVARLDGKKHLNVTITVKVQGKDVPVIGMRLVRTGDLPKRTASLQ